MFANEKKKGKKDREGKVPVKVLADVAAR